MSFLYFFPSPLSIRLTHISSGFTFPKPLPEPKGPLLGLHTEMSTVIVDTECTAVSTITIRVRSLLAVTQHTCLHFLLPYELGPGPHPQGSV